jgi:3-hydroxyisobutyryl-CoA hydrolase
MKAINPKIRNINRLKLLSDPFRLHSSMFKFNSLLTKNFCDKKGSIDLNKTVYDGVLYKDHSKSLTEVILNKPKSLNSLDLKMVKNLLKKIRLWIPFNIDGFSSEGEINQQEKKVPKVVLFTGNGKAFCAGGDIVSLYHAKKENANHKILKDFFRYEYLLDYSITKLTPIQVSMWHGAVMGGGVGLSINSPFRICTDSSIFAMPEASIGLFTDVGASYFLPRIMNSSVEYGLYLGLTGEKLKGKELAQSGIATHYVQEDKFSKLKDLIIQKVDEQINLDKLSSLISQNSDYTYSTTTFSLNNSERIKYVFKLDSVSKIYERLNKIINNKLENTKELNADLSSEESRKWAEKTKSTLDKQSPLSLCVIFELLKRGLEMHSIDEAYDVEAQVVAGFMEDSDFFEGVRALLVDKDRNPNWKHKSVNDINHSELVKKYFERSEQIDVDPTKLV